MMKREQFFEKCYLRCVLTSSYLLTFTNILCTLTVLYHGTIIRTGITCKKDPSYMCESACRWFIVKKVGIF